MYRRLSAKTRQLPHASSEFVATSSNFGPDRITTSSSAVPAEAADMNIWHLTRTDVGWSTPELLLTAVNSAASDMHVSISKNAVWVASRRESTLGRSDLYRVDYNGIESHLPTPLNDENSQPDLWISPDESWMVLAITGHPDGFGGDDLPKPRIVVIAYTGHTIFSEHFPPTFIMVSEDDGIVNVPTVDRRVENMRNAGIEVEYRKYKNAGHGFGLGTGTDAEGWIEHAIQFWKKHLSK